MNELSWQWVVLLLGVLGIICYFAKSTLEMFLFRPKVNNNPQGPLMGPPQPGIEEKAMQVWDGIYGNGTERKYKLGSDYQAVQKRVNEMYRNGYRH